jgi:hypothetical protein
MVRTLKWPHDPLFYMDQRPVPCVSHSGLSAPQWPVAAPQLRESAGGTRSTTLVNTTHRTRAVFYGRQTSPLWARPCARLEVYLQGTKRVGQRSAVRVH